MRFCATCSCLDIQSCRRTQGLLTIYRLQALESTAKDGCCFCQFLCETLEKEIQDTKKLFRGASCLYLYMLSDGKEATTKPPVGLRINELRVHFAPGYWGMSPRLLFEAEQGDIIYAQHSYRVLADIGLSSYTPSKGNTS